MVSAQKKYLLGSLINTIVSLLFLCLCLSTESWVEGEFYLGNQKDTMNYGLIKGTYNKFTSPDPGAHRAYMTCIKDNCAFSCRKTEQHRLDEISMVFLRNEKPNFECKNQPLQNGNLVKIPISANTKLHTGSYALIGIAMLFLVFSGMFEIWNICFKPKMGICGNVGIIIDKSVSLICCSAVFIWWIVDFNDNTTYRPFPVIPVIVDRYETQNLYLGYSYWFLLVPIIDNIISIIFLSVRNNLMKDENPPIFGMAR